MVLQSPQRDLRFAGDGLQGRPLKTFFVQQLQRSVNQFALVFSTRSVCEMRWRRWGVRSIAGKKKKGDKGLIYSMQAMAACITLYKSL